VRNLSHERFVVDLRSTDIELTAKQAFCLDDEGRHLDDADVWNVDLMKDDSSMLTDALLRRFTPLSSASAYKAGVMELMFKACPDTEFTSYVANLTIGDPLIVSNPHLAVNPSKAAKVQTARLCPSTSKAFAILW